MIWDVLSRSETVMHGLKSSSFVDFLPFLWTLHVYLLPATIYSPPVERTFSRSLYKCWLFPLIIDYMADDLSNSRLFQPLTIANGRIELKHRVIYAPMTRNRGLPLNDPAINQSPVKAWYPDKLMAEYYGQRANEGGLLISEGIPPSQQVRKTEPNITYWLLAESAGASRVQASLVPPDYLTQSKYPVGDWSRTPCTQNVDISTLSFGTADGLLCLTIPGCRLCLRRPILGHLTTLTHIPCQEPMS